MTTMVPPETTPEERARPAPPEQAAQRGRRGQHEQQHWVVFRGPAERWTRGMQAMPGRYALVALGSALLMIGIPLSVPMGPAESTAWRELVCLLASGAGLALLLVAGLRSRAVDVWCARRRWLGWAGLGVALVLALAPLFFAFRSLTGYFAFVPWLALYAVHGIYRRQTRLPRSRLGRVNVQEAVALVGARLHAYGSPRTADPGPAA